MDKRGQITLFIVLGIALLLIVGLITLSRMPDNNPKADQAAKMELQQEGLRIQDYISSCLKQKLSEAETFGLKEDLKSVQEEYIKERLKECSDLSQFNVNGVQIDESSIKAEVALSDQVVAVKVTYPIVIRKGQESINLENFNEYIKREAKTTLIQDESGTIDQKIMLSGDKKAELKIPSGVQATKEGYQVGELMLNILDRNFNNLENSVVSGGVVYEGLPEGIEFDEPIQIIIEYDPDSIPPGMEDDLSIAYYDDEKDLWIGLDSEVDKDNHKITAQTTHFTKFAVVIGCGTSVIQSAAKTAAQIAEEVRKSQEALNFCTSTTESGSYCADPDKSEKVYYCHNKKSVLKADLEKALSQPSKQYRAPEQCKTGEACIKNPNGGFKECKAKPSSGQQNQKVGDNSIQSLDLGYVYQAPCYTTGTSQCPMWVIKKKGSNEFARTEEQTKGERKAAQHTNEKGEDGPMYAPQGLDVDQYVSIYGESAGKCEKKDWDSNPQTQDTFGYSNVKDASSKPDQAKFQFKLQDKGNTCVSKVQIRVSCDDDCKDFKLNGKGGTGSGIPAHDLKGAEYTVNFKPEDLNPAGQENTISMTVINKYEACSSSKTILELAGTGALENCPKTDEPLIKSCKCGNKNALVAYDETANPNIFQLATKKYSELSDSEKQSLKDALQKGIMLYCKNGNVLKSEAELTEEKSKTGQFENTFNELVKDDKIKECCKDKATIYPDISREKGKEGCEVVVCKKAKDKNSYFYWAFTGYKSNNGKVDYSKTADECKGTGGDVSVPCGVSPAATPTPPPQNVYAACSSPNQKLCGGDGNKFVITCTGQGTGTIDAKACDYGCSKGSCNPAATPDPLPGSKTPPPPECSDTKPCADKTRTCINQKCITTTELLPCDSQKDKAKCENKKLLYCKSFQGTEEIFPGTGEYKTVDKWVSVECSDGCILDAGKGICKAPTDCKDSNIGSSRCKSGSNKISEVCLKSEEMGFNWVPVTCTGSCINGRCSQGNPPPQNVYAACSSPNQKLCGGDGNKFVITCTGQGTGTIAAKACDYGCSKGACNPKPQAVDCKNKFSSQETCEIGGACSCIWDLNTGCVDKISSDHDACSIDPSTKGFCLNQKCASTGCNGKNIGEACYNNEQKEGKCDIADNCLVIGCSDSQDKEACNVELNTFTIKKGFCKNKICYPVCDGYSQTYYDKCVKSDGEFGVCTVGSNKMIGCGNPTNDHECSILNENSFYCKNKCIEYQAGVTCSPKNNNFIPNADQYCDQDCNAKKCPPEAIGQDGKCVQNCKFLTGEACNSGGADFLDRTDVPCCPIRNTQGKMLQCSDQSWDGVGICKYR